MIVTDRSRTTTWKSESSSATDPDFPDVAFPGSPDFTCGSVEVSELRVQDGVSGHPRLSASSRSIPRFERASNGMISITREPIDYAALTELVRSDQAGAVVLFLGTVRELTGGRQTVALDYEAYPGMAEKLLGEVESEARARWPIINVALAHRLGHLGLGDISVAIAVSCPHRDQAFEAGRFLIDTLKVKVPIWKKENWADGTTEWVHPGVEAGQQPH